MGSAPTNRHAIVTDVDIPRFHDGKMVEAWARYDTDWVLLNLPAYMI
jgi:hypothetical protein